MAACNLRQDDNASLYLHEDEPVSEPELLHDDGDVIPVAGLGAAAEH